MFCCLMISSVRLHVDLSLCKGATLGHAVTGRPSSSSSFFLGVCVHMHHVNFFFLIIFKGKSLSCVHVCLCAQACVPRIFF